MKHSKLLLVAIMTILLTYSGCRKDEIKQKENDSYVTILKKLGYRTSDIIIKDNFYIVEGDILIRKDAAIFKSSVIPKIDLKATADHKVKIDQAVTDYKVSQNTINVYIDNSIPSNGGVDDWRNAITSALSYWNAVPNSRLYFVQTNSSSNADITIQSDNGYLPNNAIAAAFPPNSGNQPGNILFINLDYSNDKNVPEGQKSYNISHELGHNVGLRHSNWNTLGESAYGNGSIGPYSFYVSGANLINGTRNSTDGSSVMNGNTAESTWNGFSLFDILAIRTVYPLNIAQSPIFRYVYTNSNPFHFYTTNWNELGLGTNPRYEQPSGYVYNYAETGTVPYYRYFNPNSTDHYYTTNATTPNGYNSEGIMGYVYTSQMPGTIPLYGYFKPSAGHFYTIDANEISGGNIQGYTYEGVSCYVLK